MANFMADDIEVGIFASHGGLPGAAIHNERLSSADHATTFAKRVRFTVPEHTFLFSTDISLASHAPQGAIPEPNSMLLFAIGSLVVGRALRKKAVA